MDSEVVSECHDFHTRIWGGYLETRSVQGGRKGVRYGHAAGAHQR